MTTNHALRKTSVALLDVPLMQAALALILTGLAAFGAYGATGEQPPQPGVTEVRTICQMDVNSLTRWRGAQWQANAVGGHLAWVGLQWTGTPNQMHTSGPALWLDGKVISVVYTLASQTLAFSPRGDRLAWWEGDALYVYDLQSGGPTRINEEGTKCPSATLLMSPSGSIETVDDFSDSRPVFSPDGRRIAGKARVAGGWAVLLDGKAGPTFDSVKEWGFDASGDHCGYLAQKDGAAVSVLDHRVVQLGSAESEVFEKTRRTHRTWLPSAYLGIGGRLISEVAPSPDGKHLAWVTAPRENTVAVVVDGAIVSEHWDVPLGGDPIWCDSRTIRWVALEKPEAGNWRNEYAREWLSTARLLEYKCPENPGVTAARPRPPDPM